VKGAGTVTTTSHTRSVHVDAPVEKVFDHVKDPHNQLDLYYTKEKPAAAELKMTPDSGEGSTWKWMSGVLLFIHLHGTMTREAYVPNERIVDQSSTGIRWTYTVEPDQTGTTLSLAIEAVIGRDAHTAPSTAG
jgi:uncharacterized protein YndB with AHSA1/START domain